MRPCPYWNGRALMITNVDKSMAVVTQAVHLAFRSPGLSPGQHTINNESPVYYSGAQCTAIHSSASTIHLSDTAATGPENLSSVPLHNRCVHLARPIWPSR
jgi:hypothetical protein